MQGHPRSRDAPRVRLTHHDRTSRKTGLRRLASTHKVYACMSSTPPNRGAHHTWPKDVAQEHACGRPHNHLRDCAVDSSKHSIMHACAGRRVTAHTVKQLQCKKISLLSWPCASCGCALVHPPSVCGTLHCACPCKRERPVATVVATRRWR